MDNNLPTREECLFLMKKQGMLPNIVRHSLAVERVAVFLCQTLIQTGEVFDLQEIVAAALLHDITKTSSIHTRENHAQTGKNLLKELGYHRIGEIIGSHIELPPMDFRSPQISAEEIVNYADKRVCQESIVTLAERFQDLVNRYGVTPEACFRLKKLEEQSIQVEKKIFSKIKRNPDTLPELIIYHEDMIS